MTRQLVDSVLLFPSMQRRRMCPKRFCRCFEGLFKCIKRVHNKTMDYIADDDHKGDCSDRYFEEEESFRNMSGPPIAVRIAAMIWRGAKNGSKGNETKVKFSTYYYTFYFTKCFLA